MGRSPMGIGPYFFDMYYQSTGILRYSPKLLGDRTSEKWWLVLDCDVNLGKYYRDLFEIHHHHCQKLMRPAWADHITVVRNEKPPLEDLWEKYSGEEIVFSYKAEPATNGCYWWLPVRCSRLLDIREELGLSRNPAIPLHFSFGHTKDQNV